MDFQLTLSANSKVDTERTLSVSKLGECAVGIDTCGVGKIGPHGPLPLTSYIPVTYTHLTLPTILLV